MLKNSDGSLSELHTRKKSSGVDVSDPSLYDAWENVRNDCSSIDWLWFTYENSSKNRIAVHASGDGGLSAMVESMSEDIVMFGVIRVNGGKFVTLTRVGELVGGMTRGRAGLHRQGVLAVFEGAHAHVDLTDCEASVAAITARIGGGTTITGKTGVGGAAVGTTAAAARAAQAHAKAPSTPPAAPEAASAVSRGVNTSCATAAVTAAVPAATLDTGGVAVAVVDRQLPQSEPALVPDSERKLQFEADLGSTIAYTVHAYDALKQPPFPNGVNVARREQHLSDEEFMRLFGLDKAAFAAQPTWKQIAKKKSLGLF